jgi:hypothetical protein
MLIQRVDLIRESIMGMKRKNCERDDEYWEYIAQLQWDEVFSHTTDLTDMSLRLIASEVYGGGGELYDASIDKPSALDVETGESQSTSEVCDQVDKVVLQITEERGKVTYEFGPLQEYGVAVTPTTTVTPLGTFQRFKLIISHTDDKCEAIFPHAKIVATVYFRDVALSYRPREVMLSLDSLSLPTVNHTASQDDYDEVGIELPLQIFTSKEWRQLGSVEAESAVIQLGFKRLARGVVPARSSLLRGYSLSQAFVSIRSPST